MLSLGELLQEAEHLPAADKWQLVKHLLDSLEHEQSKQSVSEEYQAFLQRMYGSLRDTTIERWEQGHYEDREPLE